MEKFEESTIYERDRLNELRTAVLEQIQRPAMIPTTHPSSTTFESLLPTIPRPTVHEETLSDEGLLGEISPTISKKVLNIFIALKNYFDYMSSDFKNLSLFRSS